MAVQAVLVSEVEVDFSPDLFCKFARCSKCRVYVYRINNKFGLYIGDVVPYTFYRGKLMCISCYREVVG